jgi:hypothetical protein
MRTIRTRAAIAGLATLITAACGGAASAPAEGTVVTGRWNGVHVSLELDAHGGRIEYDCAHGGLDAPLRLDGEGRFDVAGVHVRERGGPARDDLPGDSLPARYRGLMLGDLLTLRVSAGEDSLGPFTLRRDAPVQLFKCL